MKFLHTADLHIGKRIGEFPLLDDQREILSQIVNIAETENVDAVLIAGDVYQTAAPSAEAMEVFDGFIEDLVECGKKVFIISGNHDSDKRISYFSSLVRKAGVYSTSDFSGTLQKVELEDEYGSITISLLPFIKPLSVRKCYPDVEIESHNDAVKYVLEQSSVDTSKRNVLVAHQFITGAVATGDEECSVGGLDNVDASLFDSFDYVALGHIHGPQKVGREVVRYAGSPLKYSLSEVKHKKSVTIIDMKEKGSVEYRLVDLVPLHDMRDLKGTLEEIRMMTRSNDYVRITVSDETVPADAIYDITSVFPNLLGFYVNNSKTGEFIEFSVDEAERKGVPELFIDFFKQQNNDVAPTDAHMKIFNEVYEELKESGSYETY